MKQATRQQEILHLSQSIALMRSLNNHLLQTREFSYGSCAENTIDDALFQLDFAISELDKIRDDYSREIASKVHRSTNDYAQKNTEEKNIVFATPAQLDTVVTEAEVSQKKIDADPMSTMINRSIPELVKQHLAQQKASTK